MDTEGFPQIFEYNGSVPFRRQGPWNEAYYMYTPVKSSVVTRIYVSTDAVLESTSESSSNKRRRIILASVSILSSLVIGIFFLAILYAWTKKKRSLVKKQDEPVRTIDKEYSMEIHHDDTELTYISLTSIMKSTNDFSNDNKVGEGGFGLVYKMSKPVDEFSSRHSDSDAEESNHEDAVSDNEKPKQQQQLVPQFEAFTVSSSEGLEKGYERFQHLLSQLEAHGFPVSTEDANHKFLRSMP
ncbi:GPCR kinase [Artemisia annua]|uniref:GPCR kinase n=1 Tax=Artemisia annua TaxID=35608 RepID=A0A2U1Q7X9_ARTAN|nr:GPCR kinase [Artemisia annua]